MEAIGFALVGLLICMEFLAFVIGLVGVIHTHDLGGRLVGLAYGLPTILLAVTPPVLIWRYSPGLHWWHVPLAISFALGCLAIAFGFRKT